MLSGQTFVHESITRLLESDWNLEFSASIDSSDVFVTARKKGKVFDGQGTTVQAAVDDLLQTIHSLTSSEMSRKRLLEYAATLDASE